MATASSSSTPPQQPNDLGEAFHEIVPPSIAFSSSSNLTNLPCDVFINHCGTDVKYTLATTICNKLTTIGLRVFLDVQSLRAGDVIPTQIQHAMTSASLHIAIFSTNYAQSPWCLAELSFMLKTGAKIIPVFNHVDPSDLRWVRQDKGIYAPAFSQHEEKRRYTSNKIQEWKTALESVSFHSGCVVNNNRDEGRVLKNIVNMVSKAMDKVPIFQVAKHPVGLDEVVQDFERSILRSAESEENVQIVGIVGMGGAGKTTLAKQLYNQKCSSFHNSSFIFEVRDAGSRNALHEKQKKLLKDLGAHDKDLTFDNTEEGRGILERWLRSLCALIVLDDVDHEDQLDALLPAGHRLGSGSLIIVTSRELGVLTKWRIVSIYKMKPLTPSYAKQLFCWHAFLQPHPLQEFEDLVEKFVNACSGLPLSLKVFGGQVYDESKEYWKSQLLKISRILPEDIIQRLKVSYDALDKEEQEVFMDVACFFIGERIDLAISVWDGSEWSGLHSWQTLMNKCLVDVDEDNFITMHDHLRDLGRDLAKSHSPSRLWHQEQISGIQKQTKEIRGIKIEFNGASSPSDKFKEYMGISNRWFRRPLPSSLGLKLLIDGSNKSAREFPTPGEDLVWFRRLYFQKRKLPSWLSLQKLRILELKNAWNLEKLWPNADPPLALRELTITESYKFQIFPKSIGYLKCLKMIIVDGSLMESLPQEFCDLESLEHLELRDHLKLSSLPSRFGDLTNLRHIDFSGCRRLEMLPGTFKQLIHLQHLNLSHCWKLSLRLDMMENMTKLEYLNFDGCRELKELPHHITNQAPLRELNVKYTGLKVVPSNIGQLGKLQVLEMGNRFMESFPSSLGNLSSLTRLKISGCKKMEYLPDSLLCLNMLEALVIKFTGVKSLANVFRQVSDVGVSPLSELGSCSSLCKLKRIELEHTGVSAISISEDCCPNLETLILRSNYHLTGVETLPTSVKLVQVTNCKMLKKIRANRFLINLESLFISKCPELDELPSFTDSASLKEIILQQCGNLDKIEGLESSRSLEKFAAKTRWKAPGVQSLEGMERLKSVMLVAENRSALQPCIQTIKKWPLETLIGGRAVNGVESVMDSFAFPSLSIVRSLKKDKKKYGLCCLSKPHQNSFLEEEERESWMEVECAKMQSSDVAIVCFLICSFSKCTVWVPPHAHIWLDLSHTNLRDEKWVFVSVLKQGCRLMDRDPVCVSARLRGDGEIKRGMLVVGEEGKVLEAFIHFWDLFMSS